MKHFILWGLTLAAVVLGGCSDDYDDTELRTGLNDLRDRVAKLETQLTKLNGEITTIDALVRKLESNVSVVKVEPGTDGKSYTIYFSDDTKAVIANGQDGVAGKDAPVIGVKEEDGVYYWAQTIDGKTTILEVDGQKLRVTAEVTPPRLSVDEEGYWEASYDGGDTWERITNAAGEPVKAVTDDGSSIQDSFFSAVTQDDGNVYFTLTDGSVITVAKRTDFYLILRKAPDVAPFVYGETKTYEIESAGVAETILTKPDGWRVALKDDVLSVTAPAADAAGFEAEGTVAVIYFDGAERSSVAKLGVVVDKSQTGVTEGDDFTIDITEVTDKSVTATVTPKDASIYYYVSAYDAETFDEKGEAAVVAELKAMFDFYVQYGMWDYYKETLMSKGTATYTTPEATPLAAGASYYLIAFGLEENSEGTAYNIIIMEKCKDDLQREFYIQMTKRYGWTKRVLTNFIEAQTYEKYLLNQTNFDLTLTEERRVQAKLAVKDEYTFDFAELSPEYSEHELEMQLVNNIRSFLIEMGGDFTFIGNQYHLMIGSRDLYIDLLLFHRRLRSLIAIELKIGEFEAEYAGKMQMYLTALDEQVKLPDENPSIGIIICKSKDKMYVEYALKQINAPIGVATYQLRNTLPEEMKAMLPEPEEIVKRLRIFEKE